ncbi:hypothetical protein HYV43_00525 [Candidatus Micrarchaeota archaeon]|nr:hypothetical protein [Candidatus Micrarchaeota archaeon]
MTTDAYFFDSYALIELLKANANYFRYTQSEIIMTNLNLFEVYHAFAKQYGQHRADRFFDDYKEKAIPYDEDVIRAAVLMKIRFADRRMSMADVIGYMVAAKKDVKFLTGDRAFEDLPNVEFVK